MAQIGEFLGDVALSTKFCQNATPDLAHQSSYFLIRSVYIPLGQLKVNRNGSSGNCRPQALPVAKYIDLDIVQAS